MSVKVDIEDCLEQASNAMREAAPKGEQAIDHCVASRKMDLGYLTETLAEMHAQAEIAIKAIEKAQEKISDIEWYSQGS